MNQERDRYEEIKELYDFVAEQVLAGLYKSDIIDKVIEMGVDQNTASELVDEMERRLFHRDKRSIVVILKDRKLEANLSKELRVTGYDVFSADDGERGFQMVRREIPNLIIMESELPDISGHELIKKFRKSPISYDIPIFVFLERKSTKDSFMIHGLIDVFEKPVGADDVVERVKRILVVPKNPWLK